MIHSYFFIVGDTASNLIDWVRFLLGSNMQFPHIKMIYPNAPLQPYTPMGGEVWHTSSFIDVFCVIPSNTLL